MNIENSIMYDEFLEQIGKKNNVLYRGILPYTLNKIRAKKSRVIDSEKTKWMIGESDYAIVNVVVLDINLEYQPDAPMMDYDAIFINERNEIIYCELVRDYNFGTQVFVDNIGITDEEAADSTFIKIKHLDKGEIEYYLDLMNRFEISRKKYFDYKNRIQQNEVETKKENKNNLVKKILGYCAIAVAVYFILKNIF
jgi:hypothetical protein